MLSRTASCLYWIGRYLQRAENTARLVGVHQNLLLDLPPRVPVGWQVLVDILGAGQCFAQRHEDAGELEVVRFLLIDEEHPGSVVSSLRFARENLRTTREAVPREIWEHVNGLYLHLKEVGERGVQRRNRRELLERVIDTCQLVTGLLISSMSRDEGFLFLRLGSLIEQADMTTRIIDVRSVNLIGTPAAESLRPFQTIQWMSVLKSLTAYQMYRLHVRRRVTGSEVLRFLLQDRRFPRSVHFCLLRAGRALDVLPDPEPTREPLHALTTRVEQADVDALLADGLSGFLDGLQLGIARLSDAIEATWFHVRT